MATAHLLGMPAELIIKIIDYVLPESHLNLALACRCLHQLSGDVLQYHKQCYQDYSVSSDVDHSTIPHVLEKVLKDSIAAWHIRDLEFQVHRQCWSHWADHVTDPSNVDEKDLYHIEKAIAFSYLFGRRGLEQQLEDSFATALQAGKHGSYMYMDMVHKGCDEPWKLLIIALSPRLRSLKLPGSFNQRAHAAGYTTGHHPLTLLLRILHNMQSEASLHQSQQISWPPGFASLRSVSMGIRTTNERGFILPFTFVKPLFLLPNIQYLYIDHPHGGNGNPEARLRLARRSSTVKHLHITSGDLELNEISEALAGIAKLTSFSLQSLQRNGGDVIRFLAIHHGEYLQYLDMCDTDVLSRLYERYFSRMSVDGLRIFSNLKYIAIDLLVLLHQHIDTRYAHPGQLIILKPRARIETIELAAILPSSIAYVALKISSSNYKLSAAVADAVSSLIAKTIRNKDFPNLKAVFFEDIAPPKQYPVPPAVVELRDVVWFEEVVAAGVESGVEVCTCWTHPDQAMRDRKDALGIPRAMVASDMKSNLPN